MRVSIIGTGYVGVVTGACLAELGNYVTCIDVVKEKVDAINAGKTPIFEPGLEELIAKNLEAGRLRATLELAKAVEESEVTFICVGTPPNEDGSSDLSFIRKAAEGIGKAIAGKTEYHVVVVKSTVPPGTSESMIPILEKESGKKAGEGFGVAMNPEFLREGNAVKDFMEPDRVVIGGLGEKDVGIVAKLYAPFEGKRVVMKTSLRTAEMIKYASNSFLATKISFINEIANVCEKLEIDVLDVAKGIGLDSRIGPKFLNAGLGYGGSCFPKDVDSLRHVAKQNGYVTELLDCVTEVNKKQAKKAIDYLKKALGSLNGKKIAVLGIAFKPDTDDIREAPALRIIEWLKQEKAVVVAFDPEAMENAKKMLGGVEYAGDVYSCVNSADAMLVVTEWKQFGEIDLQKAKKLMKQAIIVDGRRVIDAKKAKAEGFKYYGIGMKNE